MEWSKKRFNIYVNELIKDYRETREFKGSQMAKDMGCTKIPRNRFFMMGIGELDRELTIEETERIYNHITQPQQTEVPYFGTINKVDETHYEEESEHTEKNEMVEIENSTHDDAQEEAVANTDQYNGNVKKCDSGILHDILYGVKNKIREIFNRKKCYNTLIRYKKYQDGSEVFAWVDNNERIDYVLKINGYRIERCGRVTEDEAKLGSELESVDIKQLFRAFSILKRYVAKLENNVEKNKAKLDAIAQILVMDEKK